MNSTQQGELVMMKRCSFVMAMGLFFAASTGLAQAQQFWQKLTCPDGKCSLLLPAGTVSSYVVSGQTTDMVPGDTNELSSFEVSLADNNISYEFFYGDYPPAYAKSAPSDLLSQVFLASVRGLRIFYHRMIDLNGVPGLAYAASNTSGWLCQVQLYYKYPKLYQLWLCTAPGHDAAASDVETFLHSFRLN